MLAIVAGNGLGLFNSSLNTIGAAGDGMLGQGTSRASLNVANGNLVLQAEDGQLAGRGGGLLALRTYNSLGAAVDPERGGWRWNYEQTVRFQGPGTPAQPGPNAAVVRTEGDGHETVYAWNAHSAAYISAEGSGAHDELRYDAAAAEWIWTEGTTRVTERYSNSTGSAATGRIVRRIDSSGNSIAVAYDAGRLTGIKDTGSQQELRLTYRQFNGVTRLHRLEALSLVDDANGLATATLADPVRLAEYDYDAQGRLTAVTRYLAPAGGNAPAGAGFVTRYGYEDGSARIASVTQSDGTSVAFGYDVAGRVRDVRDPGGAPASQLALAYGSQPGATAVTDGDDQVWLYRHDAVTGQLIEIVAPPAGGPAASTTFVFDTSGNLTETTDPNDRAVTCEYDHAGNPVLERDAAGNTTRRTFGSVNQLLTETRYRVADPDGTGTQAPADPATTRYVYDANARLRFLLSAEGRVTENRYGTPNAGFGLLTATVLYVGQLYDVTALGPAPLTEADLQDWVAALPDRTQVQLTEYRYDLRGNMSQQTSYATLSAGAGVLDAQATVTEYVHDASGLLRQRIAVRGSARDRRATVAAFRCDGMGRVVETRDASGLQTTEYDDANRRVTIKTAAGLTETREYDGRRRLVRVSRSGVGTTRQSRFVYDNADQLRMVEDAQSGRRYRFYDAARRLSFKVDATGAVTRLEYDAAGHLTRQTQYANRASTDGWYDADADLVTKSDLTVGGAGSDVSIDAAHDRVTKYEYDEAGRMTLSVDAAGTATTTVYDGLSRVIMTQTGARVTRYLYDRDGRRVGVVDALGYFTEHKYDAGGRLIETVRYSLRSPAATNVSSPVWIGVTDRQIAGGRPFAHRVAAYDADGNPPTLSVVGASPAWLSFDATTATLRGTPPEAPIADSITLRADDGRGRTAEVTQRFVVSPAAIGHDGPGEGPAWAPLPPLDAVVNAPINYVVAPAVGQSLVYTVGGGMPPGLSFDATALTIIGNSGAVGFYTILLRVTDANGASAKRTVSVRVRDDAPVAVQAAGSDQPSAWRPADTDALHSYFFHDGQGRVVGVVDEQQFLTETVYDEQANSQRTLRYPTPVTVVSTDDLTSLKGRGGAAVQISHVRYDDFGRVREVTALDGSTVTRNEYDEAGRLSRVASAAGTVEERVRSTFYNAFGEIRATLGGEGSAWLGSNPSRQRIEDAIRDYGIRHDYDTLGRRVRSVDANGNNTLYYYDRENRRTHTVHVVDDTATNGRAGEVSESTYNTFGQPASLRRYAARIPATGIAQLLAGGGGGLADPSLQGILGVLADEDVDQRVSYEYDRCGRLVEQVDAENRLTENIYNAHGELAAQVRSINDGRTTARQLDYDLNGRLVSQTEDVGGINASRATEYDAFGRVTRTGDPGGRAITTVYQDNGRSVAVTDPLQRTTHTEYDALGRVIRVTDALNRQTRFTYDEATGTATAISPEGRRVTTGRGRNGETLRVTDARGGITSYAYNRDGQPTTVTDALGRLILQTVYDKSGRRVAVTDARGTMTRFAYDARSRVVEQRVDPAGLNLTTRFEVDALGRQIKTTAGAGTLAAPVTTYAHDRKGRTAAVVIDPVAGGLQLSTTYQYDDLDNVVAVAQGTISNPNQSVTLYEFDNLGRRVKEIAAPVSVFGAGAPGTRDLETEYRYDASGRLTRRIDANRQSTWHVYDAAGQETHTIGALGDVTENRYDAAGRVVFTHRYLDRMPAATIAGFGDVVEAPIAPTSSLNDRRSHVVYDGDGQQRFTLNAAGASGWSVAERRYDPGGNVVEARAYAKSLPESAIAAFSSDASAAITPAEIEEQLRSAVGYDDDDPGTLAGVPRTFFAHDGVDRLRFTVDAMGSVTEDVRDAAGNVVATIRYAARPALGEYSETAIDAAVDRSDAGNRVSRYAFDAAGRLRYTVDTLNSVTGNEYDARGNIVATIRWARRPALSQYTDAAIEAAVAAVQDADADQVMRFVRDAGDRLRLVVDAAGAATEYTYDALGNTVSTVRAAANQITRHAFDVDKRLRFTVDALGGVIENVYDANGNLVAETRFAARPALTQFDEGAIDTAVAPLRADPANRVSRSAYDALNRLRFSVDGLGSISERVYDALGNVTVLERFAVRPPLTEYSESAIDAAVMAERGRPGNRVEHRLYDALGRVRFAALRISLGGGQPAYHVSAQELNALGQTVESTAYATPVALGAVTEDGIAAAVGDGDPSRDRLLRFVFDLAGRQIYRLDAISVQGARRTFRVGAQRFDAFGQIIGNTDYATPVPLDRFDEASVVTAVQSIADSARDRASGMVLDALGQGIYRVRVLRSGSHHVVKQEFDAFGRLLRTTQYAAAIGALAAFDRATVEAAVNAIASADDRRAQYVYDIAGRRRFTLQADRSGQWTVAESRCDAVGNVVESRRYDRFVTDAWVGSLDAAHPDGARERDVIGELESLGYSDAAPATLASLQRTRFAYDAANHVRFTIDALGGVFENVYDALGDPVTTVCFAARPAPAEFTESAIDAAVDRSDPGNRVQHSAYDALGQLRFDVQVFEPNAGANGKHGVSELRYDALGRLVESRAYASTVGHLAAYDEATIAAAVIADAARDRRSMSVYDEGGRQAYALRELRVGPADQQIVVGQVHDALGQIVQRVEYAAPATVTQFDVPGVASALIPQFVGDRTTTYTYDAAGRVRFEIRPDLSFRENQFDALGQVTETRLFDVAAPSHDPQTEAAMAALRGDRAVGDGTTRGEAYTYDAAGHRTGTVDALGNTETNQYDVFGTRTHRIDRSGQPWRCAYDRQGRKTVETTPPVAFTLRGEDVAAPAPARVVETSSIYDAFGNLIRKTEAANFAGDAATTDFEFDTLGRPTVTLSPGYYDSGTGTVEPDPGADRFRREASIVYDTLGNIVRTGARRTADAFDYTYRTYDARGQVVHEINALNHVTRYDCNAFGERETVTRHSVTITGTPANGLYWTAAEIDPLLNFGLDELGNIMEDVYARTIRLDFDKLGRKIAVTSPEATFYSTHMPGDASHSNYFRPSPPSVAGVQDSAVTLYEYNAFSNLTRQRVRANTIVEWQDTSFTWDVMGRQTRSVDAAGHMTDTSYDLAGNVVFHAEYVQDPPGKDRRTEFAYDLLDRQVRIDRYRVRYADANGVEHGVVTWTWANGGEWLDPDADVATTIQTTTYDAYARPLAVTDAAGNVVSMRYNALGHLVEVIGPARTLAPIDANGETAVDPFRNQVSETLVTAMTLDVFGRAVRQVRATSQGLDARDIRQAYDVAGNLVSTTDAEGGVKRRSCDAAGRPIRETQAIHADLGPLGINQEGLERRYVYDTLGQLTDTLDVYVDGGDLVQAGKSVVYNAFGEVTQDWREWGPASAAPDELTRVQAAWYSYDNAGHVFESLGADGLTVCYYNLLGQMTREEKLGRSGGARKRVTEYQYDVLGRPMMIRRPEFEADITAGSGTEIKLVTPYCARRLDRWGNVIGTEEGGYQSFNGQATFAPARVFRSYGYDGNNQVIAEHLGTHWVVASTGNGRPAQISKLTSRDLLGNVVKEVDEARDPQSDELLRSRRRTKTYERAGRLTAETDATGVRLEYAYDIHGDRLGTRNARGTVLFDRYDRNGSVLFHGVLRLSSPTGLVEYDSHAAIPPAHTLARTDLNAYQYDQGRRRFASATFSDSAEAQWTYTWLDGRDLGVRQRAVMGVVTERRFDPFGNKALEIDGGVGSEWIAATTEYAVGRIETYRQPADGGLLKAGQLTYDDFGEVKFETLGNAMTEYGRYKNGLVERAIVQPDVTHPNREITTYAYDVRGQLTKEDRFGATWLKTKMISYDNQGRLARVEQDEQPQGGSCDVRYSYDEWSNVRRVQAVYTPNGGSESSEKDIWYDFDAAGRMTVSNGFLEDGTIRLRMHTPGSVRIEYDATGRRKGTAEYVRDNATSGPVPRAWKTMRDEEYEYDDLGRLRQIRQRARHVDIIRLDDVDGDHPPENHTGTWQTLSARLLNLRGDVVRSEQWSRISGAPNSLIDQTSHLLSATTTSYRADGQVSWTRTDASDPKNNTETQNTYDAATGRLDSYVFNAFRTDGVPYTATFQYHYTLQNGAHAVRKIRDHYHGLETVKTYDVVGRLTSERVDLQSPTGPGTDRYEDRFYDYGADRQVIFKSAGLRLSASSPVPLPTPTDGQQTYLYAGSRLVGTVGTERLADATRFDFAYTPMSEVAGGGRSHYVVQNGDSLIDIALASYGDGALWYAIADANGITSAPGDSLPATEVGKTYAVPDVVRSSHTATTFSPFGLARVIGNDRPMGVPPPPPKKRSDIEVMAVAAVSITIQVGTTVVLTEVGVPAPLAYGIGAGLSNLGGQATSWALGMQPPGQRGIDWSGAGVAAAEGAVFSAIGPGGAFTREIWQQVKGGLRGWTDHPGVNWSGFGWTAGPGLNWSAIAGSMVNVGFDSLGPVLGGPAYGRFHFSLGGLINSAYNPSTGWAIPGSGRTPLVGAFEYAYGAVAGGLVNLGYDLLRDRVARPTDPRIDPETIAAWDALDRAQVEWEDAERLAARNARYDAQSREMLALQLALRGLEETRARIGESFDDRVLIAAARRELNAERIRKEQQRRARAAVRAARLAANAKRFQALVAAGPGAAYLEQAREVEELRAQVEKDMYAEGTLTRVSEQVNIDGLRFEARRGTYGMATFRNAEMEEIVDWYRNLARRQAPGDPPLIGNEVIFLSDPVTPAEQSRRLGLGYVANFEQFIKMHELNPDPKKKGLIEAWLEYQDTESKKAHESWRRMENAYGAAKLGLTVLAFSPLAAFDPVLIFGPMVLGAGVERIARYAGFDETIAAGFGAFAEIGSSFFMPSIRSFGPRPTQTRIGAELSAQRAARLEATQGIAIAEDVTLFRSIPAEARAARSAASAPLLLASPPAPRAFLPAARVPVAGGLLARPALDYEAAGVLAAAPYEAILTRPFNDIVFTGAFEPRLRGVANITTGGGGFPGGHGPPLPSDPVAPAPVYGGPTVRALGPGEELPIGVPGLTRRQAQLIAELRSGQDVIVRDLPTARALLANMPDVRPHTAVGHLPWEPAPRGTYRGDLVNLQNPAAPYVHPPETGGDAISHQENVHYNIYFQNGEKATIIIQPR